MIRFRSLILMLGLLPVMLRPVKAADMDKIRELVRARFPDVKQISTDALATWLSETNRPAPLLIDVRSDAEFRVSHLRNALHTDSVQRVKTLAAESTNQGRPIVVYCAVGYRSSAFAQKLQKAGVTDVFNLEGSIFQWANEGRGVFRGKERVKEVHPYDKKWGGLLNPEHHPKE